MDRRYQAIAQYVVNAFVAQLGPRLQSAFVKGSVARGDAVWGVSDLDLVLAFEAPTEADTALKRELEASAREFPRGEALVIQRIAEDRLQQMNAAVRAYWLYSCRYDIAVLYGASPHAFLPAPPSGQELASLLAPIIHADGAVELAKSALNRQESRHLAKRILHALALPIFAEGRQQYVVPLDIADISFPPNIKTHVPLVLSVYREAPPLANPDRLRSAWHVVWDYLVAQGISVS